MAKVTSKLQVTIPKSLADKHRIKPGDDIEWSGAGSSIRITRAESDRSGDSVQERLRLFDHATARQRRRRKIPRGRSDGRGWTREELYERGRSR